MNFAYGWAFSQPVRKVYYNITITALSVFIALVIGTVELVGVAAEKAGIEGGVLGFIGGLDLGAVGFIIVGLVVVTWAVAIVGYKVGNVEERWSANLRDSESG
jgi:high-affinity nickel-transport protein